MTILKTICISISLSCMISNINAMQSKLFFTQRILQPAQLCSLSKRLNLTTKAILNTNPKGSKSKNLHPKYTNNSRLFTSCKKLENKQLSEGEKKLLIEELFKAIEDGNATKVTTLLSSNYDSDFNFINKSLFKFTPLSFAIQHRQTEIVKILANKDNIHIVDKDGYTPIMVAVNCDSCNEIFDILDKAGANFKNLSKEERKWLLLDWKYRVGGMRPRACRFRPGAVQLNQVS